MRHRENGIEISEGATMTMLIARPPEPVAGKPCHVCGCEMPIHEHGKPGTSIPVCPSCELVSEAFKGLLDDSTTE